MAECCYISHIPSSDTSRWSVWGRPEKGKGTPPATKVTCLVRPQPNSTPVRRLRAFLKPDRLLKVTVYAGTFVQKWALLR